MAGKAPPKSKVLKTTQSTPSYKQQGVVAAIERVALAKYEVNTRSFHPNKNFEPGGFRFHGDNRGFSLGESWANADEPDARGRPTSRVWQRFQLDMALEKLGNLTNDKNSKLKVGSNTSAPGPGLWGLLGHEERYDDEALKPKGTLQATVAQALHAGQKHVALSAWYGGENHAFISSTSQQKLTGHSIVPTLDVFSSFIFRLERVQHYMDIAVLVDGDGFPNTESFIKDPAGSTLFLGRHVRIGIPATHLFGKNHRFMWAYAIRIEMDTQGNFGEKLWVFAKAFGGPPNLRDEYPATGGGERCVPNTNPRVYSNPFDDKPATFTWACGKPEAMTQQAGGKVPAAQPLHLSAFIDLAKVQAQLASIWEAGPIEKTTRTAWNQAHLHHNPNEGRAPEDYDLDASKWQ